MSTCQIDGDSSSYADNVPLAFALTTVAGMSTTIGSLFACFVKLQDDRVLAVSLSLSAGVMIYVSFVEIIQKAVGEFGCNHDEGHASALATSLFFFGILIGWLIDMAVHKLVGSGHAHDDHGPPQPQPHQSPQLIAQQDDVEMGQISVAHKKSTPSMSKSSESCGNAAADSDAERDESSDEENQVGAQTAMAKESPEDLKRMALITGLALALHNFPEGLATFVATIADPSLGVGIATAIALHNIPEGLCVAMPVYFATGSRWKGFLWSFLSGVSEPIGALIGWAIMHNVWSPDVFGVLFGFVSGIMIYISFRELIPTARKKDPHDKYVTLCLFIGMAVMSISLVMFQIV